MNCMFIGPIQSHSHELEQPGDNFLERKISAQC